MAFSRIRESDSSSRPYLVLSVRIAIGLGQIKRVRESRFHKCSKNIFASRELSIRNRDFRGRMRDRNACVRAGASTERRESRGGRTRHFNHRMPLLRALCKKTVEKSEENPLKALTLNRLTSTRGKQRYTAAHDDSVCTRVRKEHG